MVNIFGNKDALIGSIDLLFGAIFVLGAFIFRKSVANDHLEMGFSVIGASVASCLCFIILKNTFPDWSVKIPVAIGLFAFLVGGFVFGEIIGDGWADGSSGDSGGDD